MNLELIVYIKRDKNGRVFFYLQTFRMNWYDWDYTIFFRFKNKTEKKTQISQPSPELQWIEICLLSTKELFILILLLQNQDIHRDSQIISHCLGRFFSRYNNSFVGDKKNQMIETIIVITRRIQHNLSDEYLHNKRRMERFGCKHSLRISDIIWMIKMKRCWQ